MVQWGPGSEQGLQELLEEGRGVWLSGVSFSLCRGAPFMVAKTPPLSFKPHHLLTGQEKQGKEKLYWAIVQCRRGYKREELHSAGHSEGCSQENAIKRHLVCFLKPVLRKLGSCMVGPSFTSLSPPDSRFEDPQLALNNSFNSVS